jgi:hypothetical protein
MRFSVGRVKELEVRAADSHLIDEQRPPVGGDEQIVPPAGNLPALAAVGNIPAMEKTACLPDEPLSVG